MGLHPAERADAAVPHLFLFLFFFWGGDGGSGRGRFEINSSAVRGVPTDPLLTDCVHSFRPSMYVYVCTRPNARVHSFVHPSVHHPCVCMCVCVCVHSATKRTRRHLRT